jgi:hypothetical protein
MDISLVPIEVSLLSNLLISALQMHQKRYEAKNSCSKRSQRRPNQNS